MHGPRECRAIAALSSDRQGLHQSSLTSADTWQSTPKLVVNAILSIASNFIHTATDNIDPENIAALKKYAQRLIENNEDKLEEIAKIIEEE